MIYNCVFTICCTNTVNFILYYDEYFTGDIVDNNKDKTSSIIQTCYKTQSSKCKKSLQNIEETSSFTFCFWFNTHSFTAFSVEHTSAFNRQGQYNTNLER